jgi:hypothetical protein
MFRFYAIAALVALASVPASAQRAKPDEPIVTDRPDFTESAKVVPLGYRQVELGATYASDSGEREWSIGEVLLRLATGRRTELRIGAPGYLALRGNGARTFGLQDFSLGVKVELREAGDTPRLLEPDVALIAATVFPSGSRSVREGKAQPEVKLCFGWDLNERLGLASNLNFGVASEGSSSFGQASASVSLGYSVADRVGSFVEWFGVFPGERSGPSVHHMNGGFTYLASDDFQLDARVGFGLSRAAQNRFIGIGLATRW